MGRNLKVRSVHTYLGEDELSLKNMLLWGIFWQIVHLICEYFIILFVHPTHAWSIAGVFPPFFSVCNLEPILCILLMKVTPGLLLWISTAVRCFVIIIIMFLNTQPLHTLHWVTTLTFESCTVVSKLN